jgi:hypothetical protein
MAGMTTHTRSLLVKLTAAALLVAAIGIVVQILSRHDYPTVPPGLFVLVAPAVLVWFVLCSRAGRPEGPLVSNTSPHKPRIGTDQQNVT